MDFVSPLLKVQNWKVNTKMNLLWIYIPSWARSLNHITLPYQPFHSTWGEHRPLTIFLHFLLSWAWVSASFRPWSLRANLFCICSCLAFKISCSSGSFCCQCFCNKCSFSEIGLSALSLTPNLEDQGLLSVRILLINLLQHGWTLLAQLHVSSDHGPGELRGSGSPSHSVPTE